MDYFLRLQNHTPNFPNLLNLNAHKCDSVSTSHASKILVPPAKKKTSNHALTTSQPITHFLCCRFRILEPHTHRIPRDAIKRIQRHIAPLYNTLLSLIIRIRFGVAAHLIADLRLSLQQWLWFAFCPFRLHLIEEFLTFSCKRFLFTACCAGGILWGRVHLAIGCRRVRGICSKCRRVL